MEAFSAKDVASVLGVPYSPKQSDEPLKKAVYAGLSSMRGNTAEQRYRAKKVPGKLMHIRARCYWMAWGEVHGTLLGNAGNWGTCFSLSVCLVSQLTQHQQQTTNTNTTPDSTATRPSLCVKRTPFAL